MKSTKDLLFEAMYLVDELGEGCEDTFLKTKIDKLMIDWEEWKKNNAGCYIYPETVPTTSAAKTNDGGTMEQEIRCGKCGGERYQNRTDPRSGTCLRCGFGVVTEEYSSDELHIQERDRRIEAAAVRLWCSEVLRFDSEGQCVKRASDLIDALDAAAQQRTGGAE